MNKKIQWAELCPENNDHREIGKQQHFFSYHQEGPGFPFFHPKGVILKNVLMDYWRKEHRLGGYEEIESPMLLNKELWIRSGHWDLFRENMYVSEVDKGEFAIKPMNCPGAMLYYKEKKRSFRELPLRICELGKVHRNENSGSLHGLLRVRSFIVDDAHIFCEGAQLKSEIKNILHLCLKILNHCGFNDLEFELSVRGNEKKAKYLGAEGDWEFAEKMLQDSLVEMGLNSKRREGEAKFYGPAIDIKINDAWGRSWQCSSIQMDFNLAERFELYYLDKDGQKQIPYILHRCIFGSLERFMGMLLEHYAGRLPFWLAPVQIKLISVGNDVADYMKLVAAWLEEKGFRFQQDMSDVNISNKIKKARAELIPVIVIVGEKEKKSSKISVRFARGEQKNLVDKEWLLDPCLSRRLSEKED